MQSAVLE